MRLPAADPASWPGRHRETLFPDHQPGSEGSGYRLCSTEDLVDGVLSTSVDDLLAEGAPRATAGMLLAGSWAGLLAWSVGLGLVGADAALVVGPADVGYWRRPDGYPDALQFSHLSAAVPPRHPWAGVRDVIVLAERRLVAEAAARSMITAVRPVVDALHELTGAGRVGLWHEVADAFAGAVVHQRAVVVTPADLATVATALDLPDGPWRRRPRLQLWPATGGSCVLLHKAGCCLAFQLPAAGADDIDDDHRAFAAAFPAEPGTPDYCVSCKFRSFEESARMQRWWRARELATPGWPAP